MSGRSEVANPLEGVGMTSPAPPNPDAGATAGNALQQGAAPPQAQAPAPPTHEMTVAGLRHLDAVKDELRTLLKNPALGKSDVKSQIIDGVSSLVARRMMKPEEAVIQLSKVPSNPLDQRKWIQQMMAQTMQAERGILAHHAIGFAGQGSMPTPSADDHLDHLSALQANYGGR